MDQGFDGATGKLKAGMGGGRALFERVASPAVYQDGAPAPLPGPP